VKPTCFFRSWTSNQRNCSDSRSKKAHSFTNQHTDVGPMCTVLDHKNLCHQMKKAFRCPFTLTDEELMIKTLLISGSVRIWDQDRIPLIKKRQNSKFKIRIRRQFLSWWCRGLRKISTHPLP
jgi:hypothetical protein